MPFTAAASLWRQGEEEPENAVEKNTLFPPQEVNALFAMAIFGIAARTVSDERQDKKDIMQKEQLKRLIFEDLARPSAGNSVNTWENGNCVEIKCSEGF